MTRDILTVMNKELKELIVITTSAGHLFSSAILIGIFGLFLPFQEGDYFLRQTSASLSLYIFLVPLVICSGLVAYTFAGEKESKTLESLLATRLSNGAIFIGKILAILIYTYIFLIVTILASLVGANLYKKQAGREGLFLYNSLSCFALFAFTIPVILAGASTGVFFSLKCKDLRTAFQFSRMGWFLVSLPFITGWITFKISWNFLVPGFYALFLIDFFLLFLGTRFFHRCRLID